MFVEYSVPRLYCWDCHTMRQPDLGFADPKKHYTRAFERYALDLSRFTTIQDAARHLDVAWDTVKEIQRRHLEKNVPKGTLWLILKNRENLNPDRNEWERLKETLDLNAPRTVAYYLKENLRLFWEQESAEAAATFLDDWCARAHISGIKRLRTMAKTLQGHRTGLLNWCKCPISTGPLEGTNNKIRVLQRQAYGFRDHEFFKLKIYALHEAKHALVG